MKRFGILLAAILMFFPVTAIAHEPLDWLDDVKIYVKGVTGGPPIDAPFARVRMFTDDGIKMAYFALDERCLDTFADDKKLLSDELREAVGSIGVSYTTGGRDTEIMSMTSPRPNPSSSLHSASADIALPPSARRMTN